MIPRLGLLVLLVPTVAAYGPCPRPYVFGPQPQYGGCRGVGGYCNPCRGGVVGGAYGVQYPPQQGVRYIQPYGNAYQVPQPGGAYVTPPPAVLIPSITHPTQSTPIDHSTAIAAQSTTTDELADIFDEFKGHDEEELLTGGKHRSDTSSNANLFLTPLQPPGRANPYKPQISAAHDETPLSTSQITKDLISDNTITDSKTGFIPQSKPLPASYTQTASGGKDPFSESAGMGKSVNPHVSPLSPTLSPSKAQTMVAPAAIGSYAVAPGGPVALPQPTSPYVRPYPFGPHNVPQGPYVVSPYGGYRPVAPQPLPLQPLPPQPLNPQPLPACVPVPSAGAHLGPYPAGPYPSVPTTQTVYTRIGGGAAVPAGYVVAPSVVSPALPLPAPHGGLPPFVDCCGKCRSPCRSRVKRQFAAKLFDTEGKQFDIAKDGRCTSEELRETMMKSTTSTATLSKRVIQKAAEEQFGGLFSVFCSKEDFSYSARSAFYCQTSKNDVVCFAFKHN